MHISNTLFEDYGIIESLLQCLPDFNMENVGKSDRICKFFDLTKWLKSNPCTVHANYLLSLTLYQNKRGEKKEEELEQKALLDDRLLSYFSGFSMNER